MNLIANVLLFFKYDLGNLFRIVCRRIEWLYANVASSRDISDLKDDVHLLDEKLNKLLWPSTNKYLVFGVDGIEVKTSGDIHMAFNLKDTQEVVLTAKVVDAKGNPASLSGVPVWTVGDATVVSVVPAEDGLSAVVTAGTTFATTTVTFEVDGVTATVDVTLVGGVAASATIEVGTPTDIPVPAPEPEPVEETPAA